MFRGGKKKHIVLTGGGTAGHVMPHLALLPDLESSDWRVSYIGTHSGIERRLVSGRGVAFYSIKAGKLRRYFSWQNFLDIFNLGIGIFQSFLILAYLRPALVFSKGGFVSVPVAVAAWLCRIPVITHESDCTPGLANRLIARFARKILYAFPETQALLPASKALYAGSPVRRELLNGSRRAGLELCDFVDGDPRPVVLVMGGSQGALTINRALVDSYPILVKKYRFILLSGGGKTVQIEEGRSFKTFEYADEEMPHILALADLVVSRAGSTTLFELLALKKPMLLIPLVFGSRGDQVENALSFKKNSWARVLSEKDLTTETFIQEIEQTFAEKEALQLSLSKGLVDRSWEICLSEFERLHRV